jgi:oxaloacetate decarboxylase (Na+ extruding) subunit alpha
MAEIGFIDQTLRDGPQSLWGMRMRAQHATPALPHLSATGFDTIDLLGATSMVVMLRDSGDDPWAWVDHLIKNLPNQPLRSALRPVAAGSFGFVPEGILNLWIEVLVKHGVKSHWLFDCLYDMPLMKQRTVELQEVGGEVVPAIMYGLSELHTDEFFADRAREMASWPGVKRIYIEDAPGVLTPERAATLLPAIQAATPGVRLEIHSHNTTGLAPLVYVEAIKAGIDLIHTATMPLANGPSLPSTEAMVEIVEELGHTHNLDKSHLKPVADHFYAEAARIGYEVGVPNEYRMLPYKHQLPGGMTGTLKNQLNEYGMPEKFQEVIEEIVVVRSELGEPVMATPFSQFVGIQAVLNVVMPERYQVVPDEVLQYAMGHYGPLMRPVDPAVADKIFSMPRAKELEGWERDHTPVSEWRKRLGEHLSDEELLLRYFCPEEQVDKMLAGPPLRTEGWKHDGSVLERVTELIEEDRSARHITLAQPGITIKLRRDGN